MNKQEVIEVVSTLTETLRVRAQALSVAIDELGTAYTARIEVSGAIDKKWATLVSSGAIDGKNADERKASAWMQIPENDELVVCEANVSRKRSEFDVAELEYKSARTILEAYTTILAALD